MSGWRMDNRHSLACRFTTSHNLSSAAYFKIAIYVRFNDDDWYILFCAAWMFYTYRSNYMYIYEPTSATTRRILGFHSFIHRVHKTLNFIQCLTFIHNYMYINHPICILINNYRPLIYLFVLHL